MFLRFSCERISAILDKTEWSEVQTLSSRVYEYESLIYEAGKTGGAYVVFPYDIRKEFGRKDIRSRVGKQPGNKVLVTVREREQTGRNGRCGHAKSADVLLKSGSRAITAEKRRKR